MKYSLSEKQVKKILSLFERGNGCWNWKGTKQTKGSGTIYGSLWVGGEKGKGIGAHRLVYSILVGEIPDGKVIDHLCRNSLCVNPSHLEVVSVRENTLRGIGPSARNAKKTHCKHGHPFNGKNLYIAPKGGRRCNICRKTSWL